MARTISDVYVPSSGDPASSIWVIGESPGWEEERNLAPFIGPSGQQLREAMYRNGINPSDCFLTNLCHYRPVGDKFELLVNSQELAEGLEEINHLLSLAHSSMHPGPNVLVLAGAQPLKYLLRKDGITKWRGSILPLEVGELIIKCIPSFHPSYVLPNKSPESWVVFDKDWARIKKESETKELNLTPKNFLIDPPDPFALIPMIKKLGIVSCDIETVKHTLEIICVGFGLDANTALVIPWDKSYAFTFCESILADPSITKVFHNGVFDCSVLWLNGIRVEGFSEDTIIQAHVLDAELPRDLAFLTSIYTREPYYKSEGRSNIPSDSKGWSKRRDKKSLYEYNAKDCCVTYEIHTALSRELDNEGLRGVYTYEMELDNAIIELSMTGLEVDFERLDIIRSSVQYEREMFQSLLNSLTGKKLNIKSTKILPAYLYGELKLPTKKNRQGNITADQETIVKLIGYVTGRIENLKTEAKKKEWKVKKAILQLILKLRERDKLLSSYLNIVLHEGRAKSLHRVDGTDSGRLAAKKFVDNSGLNLQTIPRSKVEINGEILERHRQKSLNAST